MTLVCGVHQNGHIKVTDATLVKSSKVGTIMPHNHHAKLHVIVGTIVSVHSKAPREHQAASGSRTQKMVPQGSKEAASSSDHDRQSLQVTKQNCNAKGNAKW